MCVSGYTPVGVRREIGDRGPARQPADVAFDQHRNPDRARLGGRERGALSVRPLARRIDGWTKTSAARSQRGDLVARHEARQPQADAERVGEPAEAGAFGPVAQDHHLERTAARRPRLDARARAQQAIVALDGHEPADREHGRAREPERRRPRRRRPRARGQSPARGDQRLDGADGTGAPASDGEPRLQRVADEAERRSRRARGGGRSRARTGCVRAARRRPSARTRGGGARARRRAPPARTAPASAIRWRPSAARARAPPAASAVEKRAAASQTAAPPRSSASGAPAP